MADPTNPLWQVYDKLWDLLEADDDFTAAVTERNRIKYTSLTDRRPSRDNRLTADVPEVEIAPAGMTAHAHATSNGSMIKARWAILVHIGDRRLDNFFDVTFPIYQAIAKWQTLLNTDFTYPKGTFHVCRCRLLDAKDVADSIRSIKGPNGWLCVWAGETDIWFTTAELTS